MQVNGKTVVVTGGASGIGRAMATRFAREGARVAVADLDGERAAQIARELDGLGVECDVTREDDVRALVERTEHALGPVDLLCSNAGAAFGEPDTAVSASDDAWERSWELHVMAHVYAARAALPGMIERGGGYLLQTASAAGLLSQIGDAAYSTTKHAAIGLAESIAITHGDDGIRVSVVCPQYVATPMLGYAEGATGGEHAGVIGADQVAESVIQGIADERFLILPHPEVQRYREHKTSDYDRWLSGMRRLRRRVLDETGTTTLAAIHRLV